MPSVVGPKKSHLSSSSLQMEGEDSRQGTKLILECSKEQRYSTNSRTSLIYLQLCILRNNQLFSLIQQLYNNIHKLRDTIRLQ